MHKTLLLSALLSALLFAEQAPTNTPQEPEKLQTVDPVVVAPVVVQPVVVAATPEMSQTTKTCPEDMRKPVKQTSPESYKTIRINVVGQGVAPTMTSSPAQAYALAKRAAIADAYRLLAEKVKGVRIEGSDKIKNMMVQRSEIRTFVDAVIAEAELIETVFKDGLCEVEMEIVIDPEQWQSILASR
ncbi:LPP20 family lipoprotein [Campylobacterota bacterium]